MIDGVPIKPHGTVYEIPKPLSQVWSNWSPSRLPPGPRFGSCVAVFWSLGCFAVCSLCKWASDCGNISRWSPGQEWKTIKSIQLSSLMRYWHSPGGSTAQYLYCVKSIRSQKRKILCRVHILLVHRTRFSYCWFPLASASFGWVSSCPCTVSHSDATDLGATFGHECFGSDCTVLILIVYVQSSV